ncbi:ABC transporter permease [Paenibacillus thiaminolyticus]|uniref:ABC transporter permease n=1 Tax=Paenibacillus thiaminolyticus TaxID=49283 RepID=UPI003D2E6965
MMTIMRFARDIFRQRHMILSLAKKDFKSRYLGSYLGVFWAFIQPSLLVFIYWFVFQVGFRSTPVEDFPFILWLLAGIVPWFYFSDSLASSTNSIEQNSYLVKKIVFNTHFLPIVKIVSSLMVHFVFMMLMFLIFFSYGESFSLYQLQIFYYSFALTMFLVGLSWIVSSLNVFLKDIGQIVSIILQFGFWLTPIFWTFKLVPEKLHWLFKLNPIYYIVEGYRDSLINQVWFWHHYNLTLYFWGLTVVMLVGGARLFKKLSPHFSDVL